MPGVAASARRRYRATKWCALFETTPTAAMLLARTRELRASHLRPSKPSASRAPSAILARPSFNASTPAAPRPSQIVLINGIQLRIDPAEGDHVQSARQIESGAPEMERNRAMTWTFGE
jgi:hypothetical protein